MNIPTYTVVVESRPKITLESDIFGGISIKLDDFVFVKVNYDHRYTDNAHRLMVAEAIGRMLGWDGGERPASQAINSVFQPETVSP